MNNRLVRNPWIETAVYIIAALSLFIFIAWLDLQDEEPGRWQWRDVPAYFAITSIYVVPLFLLNLSTANVLYRKNRNLERLVVSTIIGTLLGFVGMIVIAYW